VTEESQVATNTYKRRQAESFAFVGGGPDGWRVSTVRNVRTSLSPKGQQITRPEFDIPAYRWVTPYSDMHPEARGGGAYCELCGWAGIVDIWYIQNDSKWLIMQVGSVCVNTFMGAEFTAKTVRKFRENKLRIAYDGWRDGAVVEINKRGTGASQWLSYSLYQFKQKIIKSYPETTSSRVILNIFKKARTFNLPIPAEVLPDQTAEQTVGPDFGKKDTPRQGPTYSQTKQTNGVKVWVGAGLREQATQTPSPRPVQQYLTMIDRGQIFVKVAGAWVKAIKSATGVWMPQGAI